MGISQVQNRPYNLKYSFSLSILFSKKINAMSQYPHLYGSPTLHMHNYILCKYGFNHVWLSQNVVNEDIFMLEFKQRVIDTFLNEAISFFEESPKCHFYRFFKKRNCLI
jgi:hypothetical protein